MDCSNSTNTNQSEFASDFNKPIEPIIFLTNGISLIGSVLNMITFCNLFNAKRQYTFWNFIRCRCICSILVCFLGSFYTIVPDIDCVTDYETLIKSLLIFVPLRIAIFASFISDLLLILNRLAQLLNKKNSMFYALSMKVSYAVIFTNR